jgi:hypothetical protein
MKWKLPKLPWSSIRIVVGIALLIAAGVTYSMWWPPLSKWIDHTLISRRKAPAGEESSDPHVGGAPNVEATSLMLTPQSRLNLGLTDEYLKPDRTHNLQSRDHSACSHRSQARSFADRRGLTAQWRRDACARGYRRGGHARRATVRDPIDL